MALNDSVEIINWILMLWSIVMNIAFFVVSAAALTLIDPLSNIESNVAHAILGFSGM